MIKFMFAFLLLSLSSFAISPGDKGADFSLKAHDGKTITLSKIKTKYVVLEWFNSGCPFVRKHYDSGNMQKTQALVKSKFGGDVTWLSIVSSAKGKQGYLASIEEAADKMNSEKSKADYFLLDLSGKVGQDYDAKTTPQMVILDNKRTILYTGAIDSISSADPDDIEKSTNYVEKASNEIVAGKKVSVAKTKPYGCSVKY